MPAIKVEVKPLSPIDVFLGSPSKIHDDESIEFQLSAGEIILLTSAFSQSLAEDTIENEVTPVVNESKSSVLLNKRQVGYLRSWLYKQIHKIDAGELDSTGGIDSSNAFLQEYLSYGATTKQEIQDNLYSLLCRFSVVPDLFCDYMSVASRSYNMSKSALKILQLKILLTALYTKYELLNKSIVELDLAGRADLCVNSKNKFQRLLSKLDIARVKGLVEQDDFKAVEELAEELEPELVGELVDIYKIIDNTHMSEGLSQSIALNSIGKNSIGLNIKLSQYVLQCWDDSHKVDSLLQQRDPNSNDKITPKLDIISSMKPAVVGGLYAKFISATLATSTVAGITAISLFAASHSINTAIVAIATLISVSQPVAAILAAFALTAIVVVVSYNIYNKCFSKESKINPDVSGGPKATPRAASAVGSETESATESELEFEGLGCHFGS